MAETQEGVIERLNVIFRRILKQPNLALKDETTAEQVKGWDSLSHVRLIVAVEKEFQIKFEVEEMMKMKKVGDLVATIIGKTQQRAG